MPRSFSPQGDLPGYSGFAAGSSSGESLVEHALLIFSALGLVGFAMVDHNAGRGFFLAIFDMCLIFYETRVQSFGGR
jgi:hypothetical protein